MIVRTCRIDGNQRYSWIKNQRSLFVSGAALFEFLLQCQTFSQQYSETLPTGPVVSRTGDLWLLGSHRLYCGSALDATSYDALSNGERAAAAITDPPYNVKIDGHVSGKGKTSHREFEMASGEMSEAEFTGFLLQTFRRIGAYCRGGALIYSFMDWRHMSEILAGGRAASLDLLNLCVWAKTNGGMGSLYRSRHELVFVFKNGKDPHTKQRSTRPLRQEQV
jgi:hypothetical protein